MGFGDEAFGSRRDVPGLAELGCACRRRVRRFVIGGLTGIVLILVGRAGRKSHIPYGPYMLVGALVGVLWGSQIADAYTRILGR
jgi:leader peptidase (prepilin peptidase)/N-methyltransferase